MKLNKIIIPLLIIFISSVINVAGQSIVKKAQVGFKFLENPISAEAIGRGGLGLVTIQNANTVFWNPAGLGWIKGKFDLVTNYTKGIADINHFSVAYSHQLGRFGVVAVDALVMDYGEFYGTRRADNDQGFIDTGTFTPKSFAFGLSFGQRVSNRFSYGVRIKYAKQSLGNAWIGTSGSDVIDPNLVIEKKNYSLGEPAVDIGAIYDFFYHKIRFGAAIHNFSREVKYEEEKFPLPFAVSFSLIFAPISFIKQNDKEIPFYIGFETQHPRDFKEKFKFGAEYNFEDMIILRSGYMGNYDERGLTLGIGFYMDYLKTKLRFDYAFQDFGIFNSVHTFSFGVAY